MFVLLHVTIALLSMFSATSTLIKPTRSKLRASYRLVGATFISGTYLVISTHSNLFSACEAGLVYLSVVSSGLFAANHRLAAISDKPSD
jgi:hypothetical protein